MSCFVTVWALARQWLCGGCVLGLLLVAACQPAPPVPTAQAASPTPTPTDYLTPGFRPQQATFFALLRAGDSVYAQKSGYQSFAQALTYYDRAQALADQGRDSLLLAEAAFARGRFYDAWNKEPQKTIDYFQRAATLLARLPGQGSRALYARYLVAHAYEKVPDSLRAVQTLRQLRPALRTYPDSIRRRLLFVVEMALSSTGVQNYALADSLLREFAHRPSVVNDPGSYDFLTHYYLVQARLDVYYRRRLASPYLDSLDQAYRTSARRLDRLFLSQQLAGLYADARQYQAAYQYQGIAVRIGDSLVDGGNLDRLRRELVASGQREQAQAQDARTARARTTGGLSAALVIISLLSFYLARQGRRSRVQSQHLAVVNGELAGVNQEVAAVNRQLDDKVAQVELLNKEIQHRVKNNLHILYSLLRMQERRTTNAEVLAQLQAARLRVESIAALHNQLLRSSAGLNLGQHLRTLISAVAACLANDRQVVTHLQTDALQLPPDSYFPLALILNEWVTNSIKYADTDGQTLEIMVSVHRHAHGTCIEYADNGRSPLAAPFPHADPESGLGTQIITLLARQLGATLTTPPHQPYHYELCIPDGAPETAPSPPPHGA
ncbi:sensor histidine kinase [Hymenobacter sp. IS2118]|uniref:sensor histidine kinase n=1 Tax=Hymenobacter sp. IS2118 TaxID=1505605 RepID=UPI001267B1EF|nr:sensor histidine kinase [Hymenobacter sp. IS2118]